MRAVLVLAASAAIVASAGQAVAQVSVDGYVRRDGTYVAPHMRSSPNGSIFDNYSTRGNVSPYSGRPGTVNPFAAPSYPSYPTYQAPSYPTYNYGTNPYQRRW